MSCLSDAHLFEAYRGMAGCYMFYFGEVCMYVGKATCITSRVLGHKDRFEGYSRFRVMDLTERMSKMDYKNAAYLLSMMEIYFITMLDPIQNVKRPCFISRLRRTPPHLRPAYDEIYRITELDSVLNIWNTRAK